MKAILASGLQRLADARGLLVAIHEIDTSGVYVRSLAERSMVTNACFLNVFIALEEFLEASFVHYMTGRMSTAKWRPEKYSRGLTADHAHRMLVANANYVDWSTPEKVLKLANLYFKDGEPFRTPLASAYSHINDMKKVRNSTAHTSRTTQDALNAVFTRWTGIPSMDRVAYEVLMAEEASGFETFYGASERIVATVMSSIADRT